MLHSHACTHAHTHTYAHTQTHAHTRVHTHTHHTQTFTHTHAGDLCNRPSAKWAAIWTRASSHRCSLWAFVSDGPSLSVMHLNSNLHLHTHTHTHTNTHTHRHTLYIHTSNRVCTGRSGKNSKMLKLQHGSGDGKRVWGTNFIPLSPLFTLLALFQSSTTPLLSKSPETVDNLKWWSTSLTLFVNSVMCGILMKASFTHAQKYTFILCPTPSGRSWLVVWHLHPLFAQRQTQSCIPVPRAHALLHSFFFSWSLVLLLFTGSPHPAIEPMLTPCFLRLVQNSNVVPDASAYRELHCSPIPHIDLLSTVM